MAIDTIICMDWCELGNEGKRLGHGSHIKSDFESFIRTAVGIIKAAKREIEKLEASYCTLESTEDRREYQRIADEGRRWIVWALGQIREMINGEQERLPTRSSSFFRTVHN
ncbi:hypothetical protein F4824DRAFT_505577 [Ustulina deusta]|nr:hypothetical protein F4824DRAFT_505577 [Ustulina deusta]